jgi:predicted short-subunit dehydrogenase-like oxidoreductase (DUF2520 family)
VILPRPLDRALYHAALALGSNGLVALYDAAAEALARAGLGARARRAVLDALLAATLSKLRRATAADVLSGPIQRGDRRLAAAHSRALARLGAPEVRALHALLAARQRRLARRQRQRRE